MKRLFFVITLALSLGFFSLGNAQATFRSAVIGGSVWLCGSCTPGNPVDLFCEDSEGTNSIEDDPQASYDTAVCDDAFWLSVVHLNNTLTDESHSGTLNCSNRGDYVVQFYVGEDVAGRESTYLERNHGGGEGSYYTQLYFNIVSEELDSNDDYVSLIVLEDEAANRTVSVRLYQSSGDNNLYLQMVYYNGVGYDYLPVDMTTNGTTALSTGAWYRLRLDWVSGTSVYMYVDSTTEQSDIVDIGARNVQYHIIGFDTGDTDTDDGGDDEVTVQMDLIGADNDTPIADFCS